MCSNQVLSVNRGYDFKLIVLWLLCVLMVICVWLSQNETNRNWQGKRTWRGFESRTWQNKDRAKADSFALKKHQWVTFFQSVHWLQAECTNGSLERALRRLTLFGIRPEKELPLWNIHRLHNKKPYPAENTWISFSTHWSLPRHYLATHIVSRAPGWRSCGALTSWLEARWSPSGSGPPPDISQSGDFQVQLQGTQMTANHHKTSQFTQFYWSDQLRCVIWFTGMIKIIYWRISNDANIQLLLIFKYSLNISPLCCYIFVLFVWKLLK